MLCRLFRRLRNIVSAMLKQDIYIIGNDNGIFEIDESLALKSPS